MRLNCIHSARIGSAVAPATIPLVSYRSRRGNYMPHVVFSSSEKGFGDPATERRSGGAKKVRTCARTGFVSKRIGMAWCIVFVG